MKYSALDLGDSAKTQCLFVFLKDDAIPNHPRGVVSVLYIVNFRLTIWLARRKVFTLLLTCA